MRGWLNLRQAAYFIVVAEEGSFTRAAARLHIAQPSLSQQIRALERQLDVDLLERTSRGVRPTAAGRVFLDGARSAVAAAEGAVARARATAGHGGGALHVATVTSLATWVLPRAVARWRPGHPGITLRITEFPDRRTLEAFMAGGEADVGIGPRPASWAGPVRWLGHERFVVVVPAADPRAGRAGVGLAVFADQDWVLYAPDHGLSELVREACAAAGFTPRGVVETRQVDAAARLAAAGLGAALVPEPAVPNDLAANRVDLAEPPLREVVAYARAAFTPAALGFVDLLAALDVGLARPDGAAPT
ncbi:LysR family transcriptional regulator [Frankia sp. QA3]|uniref:LysR family transcriptional regulator n=1 Tax=Frankia sp. QA3 TaxID=710111 RepID=UPI000269CA0A|nr:LysR family transcriptional regulator [Frankia sp. QA3]EIV93786.1 transcriptional regulator [Frankia sp. QA3]